MNKEQNCTECERDKPLWIAGIIGTAAITLVVLTVFEIITWSFQWNWFFLKYGLGFVIAGVLIRCGIWVVKDYCEGKNDDDITNWDKAFSLGIILIIFTFAAIALSLIGYNIDNSYWETIASTNPSLVTCDVVPDDWNGRCIDAEHGWGNK